MSLGGSASSYYLKEVLGAGEMYIKEAKQFLGKDVLVSYFDNKGNLHTKTVHVHDITFVPLYGGCLVGDIEDIWLDKVSSISSIE